MGGIEESEEEKRITDTFCVVNPVKVGSVMKYTCEG